MTVDPSLAVSGAEWQIQPVESHRARRRVGLGLRLDARRLDPVAGQDADRRRGRSRRRWPPARPTDPTAVVMAVERAQLSMQLAGQIRTKAVEAAQDIFHTQV